MADQTFSLLVDASLDVGMFFPNLPSATSPCRGFHTKISIQAIALHHAEQGIRLPPVHRPNVALLEIMDGMLKFDPHLTMN